MTGRIAAFGAMLQRKLSRDGASEDGIESPQRRLSTSTATMTDANFDGGDSASVDQYISTTMQSNPTSRERGRDLVSTGRGGIGNIHRSQSRDGISSEQFAQIKRGREPASSASPNRTFGRGGLGNSVDPAHPRDSSIDPEQAKHEQAIREHRAEEVPHHIVSGRGGLGNIATSTTSRSRSREPEVLDRSQSRGRASGRSAAGNMIIDGIAEEDERAKYLQTHEHKEGIQSTGRGGLANLTSRAHPAVEPSPVRHDGFSGRAGAGNFVSRSASRGRQDESHGPEPAVEHHHGIGKIMDRMKEKVHRDKHDG